MSRPIKYERAEIEAMIKEKEEKGVPIKLQCRLKGYPYVSINKSIRKYGLAIPKKYAEVKARQVGTPIVVPTKKIALAPTV